MREIDGLAALAADYDGILCDVWGVVHNGVASFAAATDALSRFRRARGPVVLVTNAPRPSGPVIEQLRSLGVPDEAYDRIVTSGDVTRRFVAARPGTKVFHLGHPRDLPFYEGLPVELVGEDEAELVSCTGLFDDYTETPEDYREMLGRFVARGLVMVCANPDIVVERGDTLVYCAGALARLYDELGGETVLAGKPHPPIYRTALELTGLPPGARVLAIGDALGTDARGARNAGLDLLFVSGGIHEADFGPPGAPDPERIAMHFRAEGLEAVGYMPHLAWSRSAGGNAKPDVAGEALVTRTGGR
ncbi:TIGR01459 family HAD-type hydrolase [Propylenella binzhouense]|uniref:TIGR01459 family HAD-type hydrolase n=1 Tax=Propylenella binzhouense TaxID=2555902 RepID=UPI0031B58307